MRQRLGLSFTLADIFRENRLDPWDMADVNAHLEGEWECTGRHETFQRWKFGS